MEIGDKIKILRLLVGKMQKDLAFELGMKAATHVNRWEKNISNPQAKMLQKLGAALKINWPWLQDSNFEFANTEFITYRPLSPFVEYSPRWLALLPLELGELLPVFWHELEINNAWGFRAPCGGGVAVVCRDSLTIVIICRPELSTLVLKSLPMPTLIDITDTLYASILFKSEQLEILFDKCGIATEVLLQEDEEKKCAFEVSISVEATASLSVDAEKLHQAISIAVQKIIADSELENEEVKISITPPRSMKEQMMAFVDPHLQNLVELVWAE